MGVISQFLCGLQGHGDMLRKREGHRVTLVCSSCQKETEGWDLTPNTLRMSSAWPHPKRTPKKVLRFIKQRSRAIS
jgi:hypothetical protein